MTENSSGLDWESKSISHLFKHVTLSFVFYTVTARENDLLSWLLVKWIDFFFWRGEAHRLCICEQFWSKDFQNPYKHYTFNIHIIVHCVLYIIPSHCEGANRNTISRFEVLYAAEDSGNHLRLCNTNGNSTLLPKKKKTLSFTPSE